MKIRERVRTLVSPVVRAKIRRRIDRFRVSSNFGKDRKRFLKWSSAVREPNDRSQLAAHLTMDYHRIEKGMALPSPRPGFGAEVVQRLASGVQRYIASFGEDELVLTVFAALKQYREFQAEFGLANKELDDLLANFKSDDQLPLSKAGTIPLKSKLLHGFDPIEAEKFLFSRHSMRQYTGQIVHDSVIEKIVSLAQKAPSVCNRQSCRLYVANSEEKIAQVLAFQNGNRGFGHTLGGVFIVTSDLRSFVSLGERNQAYVDGGIFAQQVLLAIHSQCLGGCMLNWSVTEDQDHRLREHLAIPDHDVVITMIGFGYPAEDAVVAASPRIDKANVLRHI